jgi:hypothetical protein
MRFWCELRKRTYSFRERNRRRVMGDAARRRQSAGPEADPWPERRQHGVRGMTGEGDDRLRLGLGQWSNLRGSHTRPFRSSSGGGSLYLQSYPPQDC